MDNLKTHWRNLATREQQMVFAAIVVIVLGIFYWGIWSPITNAELDAARKLHSEQKTLDYVKQIADKIVILKKSGVTVNSNGSLSSIITRTSKQYNIEITRMQPQDDKIQLWMNDVPFEALLSYLNDLINNKGLSLDSLDLKESDTLGFVQVRRIQLSQ